MLILKGLYYKLHGVHRPVTMKKSVIKRRKRVVPASQGNPGPDVETATNPPDSPEADAPSPSSEAARGSVNADGSVNLGLRLRDEQGRSLLPEPIQSSRSQSNPNNADLTAYASSSNSHAYDNADSLNNGNRLPPMTSYPSPAPRPSVSPNSFLSPSRKRSFTEMEPLPPLHDANHANTNNPSGQPKRLSSIKSILNPGFVDSDADDARRSPGIHHHGGAQESAYPVNGLSGISGTGGSEQERNRIERREMLQAEAGRMREALKAKERELEELGMGECGLYGKD